MKEKNDDMQMEHTTDHINQNIVMLHHKEAEHQFNQKKMSQKRSL